MTAEPKCGPIEQMLKSLPVSAPDILVTPLSKKKLPLGLLAGGALLAAVGVWAYWPTLIELVRAWNREPDYSHGFLVAPIAAYFVWARRERFPKHTGRVAWVGGLLVLLGIAMRLVAGRFHLEALDGWSMLVWLGGVVWLFGGWEWFRFSLPSVAFLWFMIPLPYRVERWLSFPLQRVATKLSCWSLQILGQPALAEANTLLVGDQRLEVEQACSGLRIFVGIFALAFAYMVLARRAWWENVLLVLSIVPVALVANVARIVATALLYQYASADAARKFSHDLAGWMMIPLAAGLFALVLWYLRLLLPEAEMADVGAIVRRRR